MYGLIYNMGQINCHCHIETHTPQQTQTLGQKCVVNSSNRKHRSRVNSIVSPRKIVGMHSKTNSSANITNNNNRQIALFNNSKSKQNTSLQKRHKSVQIERYTIQLNNGIDKVNVYMQSGQPVNIGCAISKQLDACIPVANQYQQFGMFARVSNGMLEIKDMGFGLGVFQYVKQAQSIQILTDVEDQLSMTLLEIGIGQFVVIKRIPTKSNKPTSISCSIITKNPHQPLPQKPTRSLPSLFNLQPQYPNQKQSPIFHQSSSCSSSSSQNTGTNYNILIENGQYKIIENKICIEVLQDKVNVISVSKNGFYRYLDRYVIVENGWAVRCGVGMYRVEVKGHKADNGDNGDNGDKADNGNNGNNGDKGNKGNRNQGGSWTFVLIL